MTEAEWIAFLQRPEIPAFNRAMLEAPEDDLPRLVFADWMDENCPDTAVNEAVRASLTNEHRLATWPGLKRSRTWGLTFTRGRLTAVVNRQEGPPQRRPPRLVLEAAWQAGWVENVMFGSIGYPRWLWFRDPPMETVLAVSVSGAGFENPDQFIGLLTSPRLTRVISLGVVGWFLPSCLAHTLVRCPIVGRLSALTLVSAQLTPDGLIALTNSPFVSGLTTLNLTACMIGDAGAITLANSPRLTNLTHLLLDHNNISDAGAAAIANSPYLCEDIRRRWRR